MATPRAPTPSTAILTPAAASKSVQFADSPPQAQYHSDSEVEREHSRLRRSDESSSRSRRRPRSSRRHDSSTVSDTESDSTVDLPPRFDAQGKPLGAEGRHDSIAEAVEAFLSGRSGRGFTSVVDEVLGRHALERRGGRNGYGNGGRRGGGRRSGGYESDEYD